MWPPSPAANQGKSWETTCAVALKYNYLYMRNKSPSKLARKDLPYKNRIPPAHEVNLCSELACSHILWSVLSLNKSLCYKFCVFSSILRPRSPRTWLPVLTCDMCFIPQQSCFFKKESVGSSCSLKKCTHEASSQEGSIDRRGTTTSNLTTKRITITQERQKSSWMEVWQWQN